MPPQTALADTTMPSRIPLHAFCCVLLPWAFTTFHQALGDPGKSLAQPPTRTLGKGSGGGGLKRAAVEST